MNAEMKKKWIDALRSDKYSQGKGWLRGRVDDFCCLGVLCDISGEGEWDGFGGNCAYKVDQSLCFVLPQKTFTEKYGIADEQVGILSFMNDGINQPVKTFEQIADYIEENL